MELFKRFPKLIWRPADPPPSIIDPDDRASCPDLVPDFDFIDANLLKDFQYLDGEALRMQNAFRRQQVAIIAGGMLTTILGGFVATFSSKGEIWWLGAVQAVLAAFLSIVASRAQTAKAQELFSANRLQAEALRAETFLFIGRIGSYAEDATRHATLLNRIAQIQEVAR